MSESTVQVIPFYAHPHVHTVINDNTFYDETTAVQDDVSLPYSTLAITGADSGIDNTFVRLTSKTVKDQIFGKRYLHLNLQKSSYLIIILWRV